jgi:photosystem II stability/assembly factor-like uncharacterized protein
MRTRSTLAQLFAILFILCSTAGIIPIRVLAQTKKPAAQKPGGANPPKFKGYFEPVNYPEDVELSDVWFVDADTGWACGALKASAAEEGGFIINTRDGGKTWKLQMGDPHSATRKVSKFFFLDATHGWATQNGSKLLRTTDGENWETVGNGSPGWGFAFISPQMGFHIEGERLKMTANGGASWKDQYQCRVKVEVDGLPHEETCKLQAITFPTRTVGYAVSSEVSDKSSVVIKTTDGGKTWAVASFIPQSTGLDNSIGFDDENTGFVMTYQSKLMATYDGAKSWHGVPTSVPGGRPRIEFANPTGWTIEGKTWTYTIDGGKHWTSREIAFPTDVVAFSLARSDRGYVVGDHGMIYRYRVVPVEYSVPHGINAPVMPGGNSGEKP